RRCCLTRVCAKRWERRGVVQPSSGTSRRTWQRRPWTSTSASRVWAPEPMRILMIGPVLDVHGPIPRIVRLMSDALERAGCVVAVEHSGQRGPGESLPSKLIQRARDTARLLRSVRSSNYDAVLVHSGRDLKALLRQLPFAMAARHWRL